jgi:hypothetical protein
MTINVTMIKINTSRQSTPYGCCVYFHVKLIAKRFRQSHTYAFLYECECVCVCLDALLRLTTYIYKNKNDQDIM